MKYQAALKPESRLYHCPVPLIGLTGGIATGKSEVGRILRELNKPVIEADQLIKLVYQQNETIQLTQSLFPSAVIKDQINFSILRELFFKFEQPAQQLQSHLYKNLPAAFERERLKQVSAKYIIYDVPLLFEKNLSSLFDTVVLVYAPRQIQQARVKKRDGSSNEVINAILSVQMDIEEKKRLSPWVIDNTQGLMELKVQVDQWLGELGLD